MRSRNELPPQRSRREEAEPQAGPSNVQPPHPPSGSQDPNPPFRRDSVGSWGSRASQDSCVPQDLEEVGNQEVTTDTKKKGVESALHLGKGAAVVVIALLITMLGTATTVPAPLMVEEDRTTGN